LKSPTEKPIVPLHLHTVYSVLDGASTIDEYVAWCKENGSPALGISDHGWCIGLHELQDKCLASGITPLPGCEFYLAPDRDYKFKGKPYDYYHVTAWAVNEKGYRNLLKLGSISFQDDQLPGWKKDKEIYRPEPKNRVAKKFAELKPRITFSELFEHNEGLVIGSGCLIGALNKALLQGEPEGATRNAAKLLEVFHGRFFIEIMPHKCTHNWDRTGKQFTHNECSDFSPDGDLQKACNIWNIDFAKKQKLPLLLTLDSHFVKPEQKKVQDVLLQNGSPDGWRFHESYHLLSTQETWERWSEQLGSDTENRKLFEEAVENTHLIADVAKGFSIKDDYHQPRVDFPEEIRNMDVPEKTKLKELIVKQIEAHGRMKWDDPRYIERLEREIAVICDNGIIDFAPYFIFLEKWNVWTRENSILSAPGRGSGAGSLLCYLLRITHLDPFKYELPFERFLSMGRLKRGKFPDIDWDLGDREPLLAKLKEVYGDKMAQCSTHGTLKIKSAIKDSCRVLLGINSMDKRVDDVTKSIANTPMGVKDIDFLVGYVDKEGTRHPGQLEQNDKLADFFVEHPQVFDMVKSLLGIPRSVGRHASAYFISDAPITLSVPTCNISGYTCTQYTAEPAQKAGLIKFDFLRVNTLADIAGCIRMVQKNKGHKVWQEKLVVGKETFKIWKGELPPEMIPWEGGHLDMYELPEDPRVLKAFADGRTESVFQFNTPALTGFCKRVGPTTIQDLSDIVALVRPGPLSAKLADGDTMAESYIKARNGKKSVIYIHPGMEPILKDTAGQIVYQEQIQRIFSDLLGYSPEEADYMREVLAKKKKQDLQKLVPEIKDRAKVQGWTEEQANVFADACIAASQYSFNRAHSASYAVVAYICQFLKEYFPHEWWTAVLQNAKVDDIREKGYALAVQDMLEMPHVNGPTDTFVLEEGKIHSPLYIVERVGDSSCRAILEAREKGGNFKSFFDFYDRVDKSRVDQTVFHNLIRCGAMRFVKGDATESELIFDYHTFRRVQELKAGKGKHGDELRKAITDFMMAGGKVDCPELYQDPLELETQRIALLPIYRFDTQKTFSKYLCNFGFMLDENGIMTYTKFMSSILVAKNVQHLQDIYKAQSGSTIGFLGLVKEAEEFTYMDKKNVPHKQATALKIQIANDGTDLECVMWPNVYKKFGKPNFSKIAFVTGKVKESREPGKYSLFVDDFKQF